MQNQLPSNTRKERGDPPESAENCKGTGESHTTPGEHLSSNGGLDEMSAARCGRSKETFTATITPLGSKSSGRCVRDISFLQRLKGEESMHGYNDSDLAR